MAKIKSWLRILSAYVPGFRSGVSWKMAVAGLYYLLALPALTVSFWLFLFLLSAPYVVFGAINAVRTFNAPDFHDNLTGTSIAGGVCMLSLMIYLVTGLHIPVIAAAGGASPSPAPCIAIGETGRLEDVEFSLTSIEIYDPSGLSSYYQPEQGYVYLRANVRVRNISSFSELTSYYEYVLTDSRGTLYKQQDLYAADLDNVKYSLDKDEKCAGSLIFSIPGQGVRDLYFQFRPTSYAGEALTFFIPEDKLNSVIGVYLMNYIPGGNSRPPYGAGGPTASPSPTARATPSPTPEPTDAPTATPGSGMEVISLTSPISPGDYATVKIRGLPGTRYGITVYYTSGPSQAAGLEAKTSDGEGFVSWTWRVGTRTKAGTFTIEISGGGQELVIPFTVK